MPFTSTAGVIRVDQSGAGGGDGNSVVTVQGLSDGGIVYAWREWEDGNSARPRIFVRKFDSNLNPLGNQVKIDGVLADQDGNGFTTPSIFAGADGSFVVEYDDFGGGTRYSNGDFYDGRVWSWLAVFDAAGALVGQQPTLGAAPNSNDTVQNQSLRSAMITANGEGGYHTAVVQTGSAPFTQRLLVNGAVVQEGSLDASTWIQWADVVNSGDRVFVVWRRDLEIGQGADLNTDVMGMFVGEAPFRINTQTQGSQNLSSLGDGVARTPDGPIVVVWTDPGTGVRGRVISEDGLFLTEEISLRASSTGNESRPMVAAMTGSFWLAVWVDERGTVGQIFGPLGSRYGDEQILIPGHTGHSAMTILQGDRLVLSWNTGAPPTNNQTFTQIWQLSLNDAYPIANNDGPYSANEGETLTVAAARGVIANDVDFQGDTLTIDGFAQPAHGSVTIASDGSFQYTPAAGFTGLDSFVYSVADVDFNRSFGTAFVRVFEVLQASAGTTTEITQDFTKVVGTAGDFSLANFKFSFPSFNFNFSLGFSAASFSNLNAKVAIGSLVLSLDTDADGSFETIVTIEDPVPNLTISIGPDGQGGTDVFFTNLALATAGNDTITGTPRLDYIAGGDGNDVLNSGAGNDALKGDNGNDSLTPGSGVDAVDGGAGNDGIYFGKELDSLDKVDGGLDTDTLAIQGNYPALVLVDVTNIETLAPLPGNDTRFGDIAGNFYDYNIATVDSNVAAGGRLTVTAGILRAGEDLTFDGSAETDGYFRVFAGQGVDNHKGGAGSDGFFFGADKNLTGADRVDGNGGPDSIALRGNYFGADAVTFQNASLSDIEAVVLLSGHTNEFGGFIVLAGFDYTLTMADGNAAAGQRLDITAFNLRSNETLIFNGAAELDGSYRITSGAADDSLTGSAGADTIFGGLGADVIAGGPGNDTYVYRDVLESTAASRDTINGFAAGDRIDLAVIDANAGVAGNDAFAFIGTAAFGNIAGQLRASQSGADTLIEADVNGDGVADLSILVTAYTATNVTAGDFIL